ncbi:MAG: heme-binding domain-containing protein [Bacteroidales bacterium]|nr:heme-binding domain-containing protein [Bacteroidales bacterium]
MKSIVFSVVFLGVIALFGFTKIDSSVQVKSAPTVAITSEIPENIQTIIDKSCVMCHNTESQNVKGKTKLNFDKFKDGYSVPKQISKYMDIADEVKETKMPPSKFIEKHPEKKLSEEERNALVAWAENMAKQLGGE